MGLDPWIFIYRKERLNFGNCIGSEGLDPSQDTPSHACTRYHHIENWINNGNGNFTINTLKKFFTTSVDDKGVYQTGMLQQYPSNEVTLYSVVGNVKTNIYYIYQFDNKKWIKINLNNYFS